LKNDSTKSTYQACALENSINSDAKINGRSCSRRLFFASLAHRPAPAFHYCKSRQPRLIQCAHGQPRALHRTLSHTHTHTHTHTHRLIWIIEIYRRCGCVGCEPPIHYGRIYICGALYMTWIRTGSLLQSPHLISSADMTPKRSTSMYSCFLLYKNSVYFVRCGNLFCEEIVGLPSRVFISEGIEKVGLGVCCFSGSKMKRKRLFLWTVVVKLPKENQMLSQWSEEGKNQIKSIHQAALKRSLRSV
jgi:hypothetical protein